VTAKQLHEEHWLAVKAFEAGRPDTAAIAPFAAKTVTDV
jgi:hypothetical protein